MFGGQIPIFLAACGAVAATGVMFSPGHWYDTLKKPGWTPPRWAFPVAWTTLYLLIALAAARVAGLAGSGTALALWSLQIALNTLWTPVFWALDTWAGVLLLPYLVWLSLAAALNLWIWRNNAG